MPLPDNFYQHLADAEKRLEDLKVRVDEGRLGVGGIEAIASVVALDLQAATVILQMKQQEDEYAERDARHHLGPN